MPAALPHVLRARFLELIEEGLSGRAAASRLKLSAETGAWWSRSIRETGSIGLAPQGRSEGRGKLDPHRVFYVYFPKIETCKAIRVQFLGGNCLIPKSSDGRWLGW